MSMQDDMNPDDAGQTEATGPEPAAKGAAGAAEKPQSRKAVWLAMGAVALALGLIWVAPGIDRMSMNRHREPPITRASPRTLKLLASRQSSISRSRTCTVSTCTSSRSKGRSFC